MTEIANTFSFRLTELCICSCAVCVVTDIPWHESSSVYAAVEDSVLAWPGWDVCPNS